MGFMRTVSLFFLVIPIVDMLIERPPVDIGALMRSINLNLQSKGGVYANYSCKSVSWDDAERGISDDGSLSEWGASITDTRLYSKDGQQLYTIRSDNWNEKLGHISSDDLKLIVGNQKSGGELEAVTLTEFLGNIGKYGGYAGMSSDSNFSKDQLDEKVSVRFQTTFLPVENTVNAKIEIATEAYNYNTMDDADPKNIVVLATSQGIAVEQDGNGAKKIFHHDVSPYGLISRYWLEAQRTNHKVGGAQEETEIEKQKQLKAGKAVSREFGIEAMGSRFNALMTIQVPLNQNKPTKPPVLPVGEPEGCPGLEGLEGSPGLPGEKGEEGSPGLPGPPIMVEDTIDQKSSGAARLSRGSKVDTWFGLTVKDPIRHPDQHVTVTIVFYHTVAGGVPSIDDVTAAVDDLEAMYNACNWHGNLVDKKAEFMKSNLTNETMIEIFDKINAQPYQIELVTTKEPEVDPTDEAQEPMVEDIE